MSTAEQIIIALLVANLGATLFVRWDLKAALGWLRLIDNRIRPDR